MKKLIMIFLLLTMTVPCFSYWNDFDRTTYKFLEVVKPNESSNRWYRLTFTKWQFGILAMFAGVCLASNGMTMMSNENATRNEIAWGSFYTTIGTEIFIIVPFTF